MSTTIESLELEILSNSKSAESGINSLINTLTNLKNATKGGMGLTSVVKQVSALSSAVNTINSSTLTNLTGLVSAIKLLNGVKVSPTIGKNITSLTEAIDKLDVAGFTTKINQMTTAITPFATQMEKVSNGFNAFSKGASKVPQISGKVVQSNNKSSKSFTDFYHKVTSVINIIVRLGKVTYSTISKTSEYIENVNLFTVSLGKYATEAKAYAEQVSEIMGIDPSEWMRAQGVFMTLATGFGVASDKAAIISKNLTQLGYDISSFYNTSVANAMDKLKSGLAGELEPLRAIGYDLSQAKLEAIALELGIDKAVSSMTQAEKAQLRYYAIMTQVTTVHGDMARTLEEPANQIRILKAQFEMLARSIGSVFIPILNKVIPYLIAIVKVLREIISSFATLVGFEMPEVDYSGVDSMASGSEDTASALGDAADEAKRLKSYMLGFDELNVISPNSDSSGGNGALSGFDFALPEYDFIGDATNDKVNGIIKSVKKLFKPFTDLIDVTKEWAKTVDIRPMLGSLKTYVASLSKQWKILADLVYWLYKDVVLPLLKRVIESDLPTIINTLAKFMDSFTAGLKPIVDGLKGIYPVLEPIINWIADLLTANVDGFGTIFGKVADVIAEKGDKIKGIITGIGDIIGVIWSGLKPILDLVVPIIEKIYTLLANLISNVLGGIIDVISGIVNLIAGVFTGDWERAWNGLGEIFVGVWDFIKNIVVSVWEFISSLFSPVAKWFNTKVIQPIVKFFKGLWESVSGFFKSLWDGIANVWGAVANWFNEHVIQPLVNVFAPIVEWISTFFKGCWMIIQAVWVVASTWFNEHVIQPIVGFFKGLWESVSGFFKNLWNDIVAIWNKVATWFNEHVIQPVVGFFRGVWSSVSNFFTSLWGDIKAVWGAVANWFSVTIIEPVKTAFRKACDKIGEFFSNLWLGVRRGVANAMNGVITVIESIINGIIRGINKLIGGFDKIVQWAGAVLGQDWGGIAQITEVKFSRVDVPTYAEGGYPASGQAFIARENGIPEMVGTIGRRTAVANNEQIVESVASGVAEANSEQNMLLREQNSLLRALLDKDSGVYLDGRSLSDSVDKYKREHGRVIIVGGVL